MEVDDRARHSQSLKNTIISSALKVVAQSNLPTRSASAGTEE